MNPPATWITPFLATVERERERGSSILSLYRMIDFVLHLLSKRAGAMISSRMRYYGDFYMVLSRVTYPITALSNFDIRFVLTSSSFLIVIRNQSSTHTRTHTHTHGPNANKKPKQEEQRIKK